MRISDIRIIAHRGYRARFPENTLAAFKAALSLGIAMIELDVTITKDRKIVVIHDETLDRTTNGTGLVKNHTLSELKTLDAGSWFSQHFTGEPIPCLDEVLSLCRNRCGVNIEIKPEAFEENDSKDTIENQVLELLSHVSSTQPVIISSFEPRIIKRLSRIKRKDAKLAFLTENVVLDSDLLDFMCENGVFSWNPDCGVLTEEQVRAAHDRGLRVMTYTVNTASEGQRCFAMGVDAVFTDEPLLF